MKRRDLLAGLLASVAASAVEAQRFAGRPLGLRPGLSLLGAAASALTFVPSVSIAPQIALGMAQLYQSYSGPLAHLTRQSDSTGLTINPVSGGQQADMSGLAAFVSGTTCVADTWYDQSGNAKDHTGTTGRPSVYAANQIGNVQPITFGIQVTGTTAGGINSSFLSNTTVSNARTGVTVIEVVAIGGGPFNSEGLWSLGNSTTAGNNLELVYDKSNNKADCYPLGSSFLNPSFTPDTAKLAVISTVSGPSSTKMRQNGAVVASLGASTAATLAESRIGGARWSSTASAPADVVAYLLYPGVLSDTELLSVERALMTIFGITATKTKTLTWDGDSLTCGLAESGYLRNLVRQINANIGKDVYTPNFGVSGDTAAGIYARRAATFSRTPTTGMTKNVLHVWMGTNDIDAATATGIASTVYNSYILPYVQAAQAAGRDVVVGTVIPRSWTAGTLTVAQKETERQNLNALIVNGAAANGYTAADYGGIAALTTGAANNPPNPTYYGVSTGVHVNPAGFGLLANLLLPIVQGKLT